MDEIRRARKLRYHRARRNYYDKATRSLAAGIRYQDAHGLDSTKDQITLAEFAAHLADHTAALQELEGTE